MQDAEDQAVTWREVKIVLKNCCQLFMQFSPAGKEGDDSWRWQMVIHSIQTAPANGATDVLLEGNPGDAQVIFPTRLLLNRRVPSFDVEWTEINLLVRGLQSNDSIIVGSGVEDDPRIRVTVMTRTGYQDVLREPLFDQPRAHKLKWAD